MKEAKLVQGVTIIGLQNLSEVVRFLEGKNVDVNRMSDKMEQEDWEKVVDFADVKGQKELIDAVILAAAGGHNMLMIGEPGCGKTMIAQRIPTILPEMTEAECLEVTKIYSISGILPNGHGLIRHRPFRAPHHNASLNALIGGGANALPGEVSLAHNGVLFLDELAEFPRRTLDALRQPIEDKQVCISRVNGTHTFPSNFMFITAISLLPIENPLYPKRAGNCNDAPIILYYKGTIQRMDKTVGIVGARRCTQETKRAVAELAVAYTEKQTAVISGMAKGVDSYAHTACLKAKGYTVAVLANGLDICYPSEHEKLKECIENKGLVISEYS